MYVLEGILSGSTVSLDHNRREIHTGSPGPHALGAAGMKPADKVFLPRNNSREARGGNKTNAVLTGIGCNPPCTRD